MNNRSLTAVPGVEAGHWTHESGTTGATAVLFPRGAVGGIAVPGSATGGREHGTLAASHLAGKVHGFCLSGGSAYGLGAADGVMAVLERRRVGLEVAGKLVPIVPAAILFDLRVAEARPDATSGERAAESASTAPLPEGRVGVGAGATVAKWTGSALPGGFGGWAMQVGPHRVAAGVAVNAVGSVRDPDTGAWVAGPPTPTADAQAGDWQAQTTLAVVVTDAPLDRSSATVLAKMATAGMARAIYPSFTPFDGDTVFTASTGDGPIVDPARLLVLGDAAATCVARAIVRGVSGH